MRMVWQKKMLGEVSQIYSGFAFRSQDLGVKGIPVLKIANIQNKLVAPQCADHFPEELLTDRLSRYFLHSDDTLIAMTGAGSVGKVGKMPAVEGKYLVNQRVGIVRPNRSMCDPSFVYYCLSQDFYETKLYALGLGAGQPNVSGKQIAELEIPSPPIPVQQRIAAILSAYDELIENSRRRTKILDAMARGLYREWFVHFRFPGHESVPRVPSPLSEIPKGWEVKVLQSVCPMVIRGVTPKYEVGSGRFIINQKVNRGSELSLDDLKELEASLEVPPDKCAQFGDVLLNCLGEGTIGRVHFYTEPHKDWAVDQHMSICRATTTTDTLYVYYALESEEGQGRIASLKTGGTNMTMFNISSLRSFALVVPPARLLEQFAEVALPMLRQKQALAELTRNLRRTRDLLLPRLLSGQINVEAP